MKMLISKPIARVAQVIIQQMSTGLDPQDVAILKLDGPTCLRRVQTNLKLGKQPLADLDDTSKKILLAYVIFLRQNVTMEMGNKPNEEDTAKILHGEACSKDKKELEEELLKQLEKVGVDIHKNDKKDDDKDKKKEKGA